VLPKARPESSDYLRLLERAGECATGVGVSWLGRAKGGDRIGVWEPRLESGRLVRRGRPLRCHG
jgi:hypothetical protein